MKRILVTGAGGQLGQCIKDLSIKEENNFVFVSSTEFDITDSNKMIQYFNLHDFDYCINCAAYTAVDKAEEDHINANKVNIEGVKYLAEVCLEKEVTLIHISTDFVFDGANHKPYCELDRTNPISVYGLTKLEGEKEIVSILREHFIIRTSWLYSEYGNNFVKTMLKLSKNRGELGIINDQIGTPTYAKDLALAILTIINTKNSKYGLYHYSNEGVASWYDFAQAIFEISKIKIQLTPIPTIDYPTPAKRPHFSVLDKSKIKSNLKVKVPYWRESLSLCIARIDSNELI